MYSELQLKLVPPKKVKYSTPNSCTNGLKKIYDVPGRYAPLYLVDIREMLWSHCSKKTDCWNYIYAGIYFHVLKTPTLIRK